MEIIIKNEVLKEEFDKIKKHALMKTKNQDDNMLPEDIRAFTFMVSVYKTYFGLED